MAAETLPPLPEGGFDGREAFDSRLRLALASAAQAGWRELLISDPDFADWPLGERSTLAALQDWSGAGRRLVMVARHYDAFARQHARFVQWRQIWSHIVDCRQCNGPGAPLVPSAFCAPGWYLHRVDVERVRGVSGVDPVRRAALRESIDECIRQSRPGFAVSTSGL